LYICLDETLSSGIFKNQITTLFITIDNKKQMEKTVVNIFDYILTVCTSLIYLTLYESSYRNRVPLSLDDPPLPTFRSSTLTKVNIRLQDFDDCL